MAALYVAIYATGVSAQIIPHWAFYTEDDQGNGMVYEALGSSGHDFKYHTKYVDILTSKSLSEYPRIGRIEADVWPEVPDLLKQVPMSTKSGWNCQDWVMEAIAALARKSYFEEDAEGINRIKSLYKKTAGQY